MKTTEKRAVAGVALSALCALACAAADGAAARAFVVEKDVDATIAACAAAGGGRVVVPKGVWETGPIHLKSNVELHLDKDAVVLFTDELEKYLPGVPVAWEGIECVNVSPLVYAYGATNVAITGTGTLKCKMDFWWTWAGPRQPDCEVVNRLLKNVWSPKNVPVAERQLWKEPNARFRPQFIHFNRCGNIRLEDFKIRGTPFWTVHLFQCDGVVARGLDIDATDDATGRMINNSDGIDIDGTQNVLVERCCFRQGDDAVVLKSGKDFDGRRLGRPTAHVVVRDCTVRKAHNLAAVGSELSGGVRDVKISNCRIIEPVGELLHVKTNARRGGFVEDIAIEDVVTGDLGGDILGIQTRYAFGGAGEEALDRDYLTPIRGITLRNIRCGHVKRKLYIRGNYRLPAEDVTVENVVAAACDKPDVAFSVRNLRVDGKLVGPTSLTRRADGLGAPGAGAAIFVPELREYVVPVTDGTVAGTAVLASSDRETWSEPIAELWPEKAFEGEKVSSVKLRREKRGWYMDVVFASAGAHTYFTPEIYWPFLPESYFTTGGGADYMKTLHPELPRKITDETPAQHDARLAWWQDARFGMFIHFGLYSVPARHEWIRAYERIDNETYDAKYLPRFNPDLFDAKAWVAAAKRAGMKYMVLTTKHHEGFCMWDTKTTDYKITKTAFGRDLVREYVDACREAGMRVGFYFSIKDWHHPDYTIDITHPTMERLRKERLLTGAALKAEVDRLNAGKDWNRYRDDMYAQIRELLTGYGKIDIIWFDYTPKGSGDLAQYGRSYRDWDSVRLVRMTRELQPGILIDSRLDLMETDDGWDFVTPEQTKAGAWPTVRGRRVPWETCQTFSGSWGYHRDEDTWKSMPQLIELLSETVSKGGNLILNVGPTARGEFDDRALERLEGFGRWMRRNARSVYGCTEAPKWAVAPNGTAVTYNPKTRRAYIHLYDYPMGYLPLAWLDRVEYAQFLHDGSELQLRPAPKSHGQSGEIHQLGGLVLPMRKPHEEVPVVELWLK